MRARPSTTSARACPLVAGSYALGVYSAYYKHQLASAELGAKAGDSRDAAMFQEEVATLRSLRDHEPSDANCLYLGGSGPPPFFTLAFK